MQALPLTRSLVATWLAVVAGTLAVGAVDLLTGSEVRVTAMYFLPLALAGWALPRAGAALSAVGATAVWALAQRYGGAERWSPLIWAVNLLTEGVALLVVTLLVSMLGERLRIERTVARTDALTGLRNRRAFVEDAAPLVALCQRHGRPVSMAFLDLDAFKAVNDRFGHERGDQVLVAFAALLAQTVRRADVAARLGGDEFVILMPETAADEAALLMGRLQSQLALLPPLRELGVTATIGLLTDSPSTLGVAALLRRADVQMYLGKRGGRDPRADSEAFR